LARLDAANFTSEPYGIPLSDAELSEMFRRARIQASLDDAIERARAFDSFAGVYLDQHNGGRPVFMFAGSLPSIEADLEAMLPSESDVQVVSARWTERELAAQREAVASDVSELAELGIRITLIGAPPRTNALEIGVDGLTSKAESELRARYGDEIAIVEASPAHADACTNGSNDCRPMKGGLAINKYQSTAVGQCTSGFLVERTDTEELHLLTAGHCLEKHTPVYDSAWEHNDIGFGRARYETFQAGGAGPADAGLITINAADLAQITAKNRMRRNNTSAEASVTVWQTPVDGGQACRVGVTSGHDCGVVTDPEQSNPSVVTGLQTMTVTKTARVNFDSDSGDSGGPVFYYPGGGTCCSPVTALGIHTHSEEEPIAGVPDEGWFSTIQWSIIAYNDLPAPTYTFRMCLSASC
jgi:hypothetical protein